MSTQRAESKQRVFEFSEAIHEANSETVREVLAEAYDDDAVLHGVEPLDTVEGVDAIASEFWEPLLTAFPDLERNDYSLFAGEPDGTEWVCASGNLVGTFEQEWLDIPPTGDATWIRYGEFHRMADGQIAETYLFVDMLDVLRQAGYQFMPAMAPGITIPGPSTHDGVQLGTYDDEESQRTLEVVEEMIFEGLLPYEKEDMDDYWHEDFMWYGPCGIGTTRGIDGFHDNHQQPFEGAFSGWEGGTGNHVTRFAEGHYCGWVGWPDIVATHSGSGWLGLPATDESVTMRVMDIWRREGDQLVENWVFIDMIDLLLQLGIDVFDRVKDDRQYF